MSDFVSDVLKNCPALPIRQAEPLSAHCTFRIGGKADFFAEPSDENELISVLRAAKNTKMPFIVVGNASNILFRDGGFRGVVINTQRMKKVTVAGETITAECGVSLTALSCSAQKASLTGFEFLCGIPGTVGGGVYMNAGAYGGEIAETLVSSRFYDAEKDEICELDAASHMFGYRRSSYMENANRVLLSAIFKLSLGNAAEIRAEMDELLFRRREKQPLEFPSAGSTFKRYPGFYTAKLIDECGLRGCTVGGAQVSEKHAGFVINRGGASASDVLELIDRIKREIKKTHGIDIECEIRVVGEE